jgi:hypothetical protein
LKLSLKKLAEEALKKKKEEEPKLFKYIKKEKYEMITDFIDKFNKKERN